MERKVLLASYALSEEQGEATNIIDKELQRLVGKPPEKILVAYLANAGDSRSGTHAAYIDVARRNIEDRHYIRLEVDLNEKKGEELKRILEGVDVIYMEGGDTYTLMLKMEKAGLDRKMLLELLDEGKVYVGVSAGAYVALPTTEPALWKHPDKPPVNYEKRLLKGLGLVGNAVVVPHYGAGKTQEDVDRVKGLVNAAAEKSEYPVKLMTNQQAWLFVGDSAPRLIGVGAEMVLKSKSRT